MKNFGLTIPVGLGDMLLISAALNATKDRFNKINMNIRWDFAKKYKNDEKNYGNFCVSILKLLLTDPKFVINDRSQNFPFKTMDKLWREHKMPPVLPRYVDQLTNKSCSIDGEYVVVTTKVRELNRALFNKTNPLLMNKLKELSSKYKIVIIGEREVEMNNEYKIHGEAKVYGMYDNIISAVKNNVVDCTMPKLGITVPNIENIKKDCTIMNNAKCVFTLGCGGNLILALAVANKIVSFRKDRYKFIDHVFQQSKHFHNTENNATYSSFLKAC
jgi:hypothetical protein